MRAALLCMFLAACLPEYEEKAPECPSTTVVVYHDDHDFACTARPAACAQPGSCFDGACTVAALALCGGSLEAVALCGDDDMLQEVLCSAQ